MKNNDHVTLVAIHTTADNITDAQRAVVRGLPVPGDVGWEEWWIADDQAGMRPGDYPVRVIDGSDNDPAVFVDVGEQGRASRLLLAMGLTNEGNEVGPEVDDAERLTEILEAIEELSSYAGMLMHTGRVGARR